MCCLIRENYSICEGSESVDLKDFKVGQTVWVQLTGNEARGKHGDELIEEWEVVTVGKKYIHAKKKGYFYPTVFEKREYGYYEKFVQKTEGCVNYILYASKAELEEELEHSRLSNEISQVFRGYGFNRKFSLEQLRKIKAIISESEEEQ